MGCDFSFHRSRRASGHFNPRIPYGMRHALADHLTDLIAISIHASRMGCDCALTSGVLAGVISIHASRMGCDPMTAIPRSEVRYFNPRIPYGMRLSVMLERSHPVRFQSTHPVWDATAKAIMQDNLSSKFQSTHPVWDATRRSTRSSTCVWNFNPRIPYGMRLWAIADKWGRPGFQSTHPVWDATGSTTAGGRRPANFNPRIPYGMRHIIRFSTKNIGHFNPRIPYGMRRGLRQADKY